MLRGFAGALARRGVRWIETSPTMSYTEAPPPTPIEEWGYRAPTRPRDVNGPELVTPWACEAHAALLAPITEAARGARDNGFGPVKVAGDLPLNGQWLVFRNALATSELDADGYENTYSPPHTYTLRMYAGGSIETLYPINVGDVVSESVGIESVEKKKGSAFDMVFVTVKSDVYVAREDGDDVLARIERKRFVYRPEDAVVGAGLKPVTQETQAKAQAIRDKAMVEVTTSFSTVDLFRYSAMTYNAHRIHYDAPYCAEEGFPGPVVHGPLSASALLALAEAKLPLEPIHAFDFRLLSPLFADQPVTLCMTEAGEGHGEGYVFHVLDGEGRVAVVGLGTTLAL